jgi:tetratricopeptide (TPR) repeat protein
MDKSKKLINWGIVALTFLLPLFFLPVTSEFFAFNKQALLLLFTGALAILWALAMAVDKTLSFRRTPLDTTVLLFAASIVLATAFASPNRHYSFLTDGFTLSVVALAFLYFLLSNNIREGFRTKIINSLIISAGLLGLVVTYQFTGIGQTFALPAWLKDRLFTPAGEPLALISLLTIALIPSLILFLRKFSSKLWAQAGFYFLTTLFIILGISFTVYQIWPITILPYRTTWVIAIEALKQTPIFGVGPGNYLSAFNQFRPASFNLTPLWGSRFAAGSSFPLHLLTIGGFITFLIFVLLAIGVLRLIVKQLEVKPRKDIQIAILGGTAFTWLLQLFLPINLLLLYLLFLFSGLLSSLNQPGSLFKLKTKDLTRFLLLLTLLVVGVVFYLYSLVYRADIYFRKSLEAMAKNQGAPTYNYQIKAIQLNPYYSLYRRALSQTSLALVNSLSQKKDISDQDKTQILQLIQQAVQEAKTATTLNQTDTTNWENLALVYRGLIGAVQGADQWTIAAYQQAIALEPSNPRLRLELGGVLYSLGNYDGSVPQFQAAVSLKPNWANAYYNLSAAYREQKKYNEAYLAMQSVLNLLPADSEDFQKAKKEFDELAKKLPKAEAATPEAQGTTQEQEALTKPEALPSPAIKPPVELEGAGPEISPTPEVSPTPTPEL